MIDRTSIYPQNPLESATTFVCLPIRHHHTSVTFPSHQRSRVKIINFQKISNFSKNSRLENFVQIFFSLINQNIKMICECFYGFYIRIKLPRVTFSFKWFWNRISHFWSCPRDFSIWPIIGWFFVFVTGISRLDLRTADFPKTVRTSDRDLCLAPLRSLSRPSLCELSRFLLLLRRSRYCFRSGVVISRPRRA